MPKPPMTYYGGKTSIAPRIAGLFPPHGHYVEPFGGSLAVLLAKRRSRHETVNDVDESLMTFWRVLRDRTEDLARVCSMTPHSRREHQLAYDQDEEIDELEKARRVWVILSQGRGGSLKKTGWRFYAKPTATSSSMPAYLMSYVDRIFECAERLRGVSLECRDAVEIISTYGQHDDVLIYADPPYLASARSSYRGDYRHEMGTVDAHRNLADLLKACRATVVLSGYHSPLYDELYADWHSTEFVAFTGQANLSRSEGARVEVLWSNRVPLQEAFAL